MLRFAGLILFTVPALLAQATAPSLSLDQKEDFLLHAEVERARGAKKGITDTVRATLSDGAIAHDASIQRIDEEQAKYETERGTEYQFRDCYKFNIAAYRLARLLGLEDMVPPSIERKYEGKHAAWTWWIENVQMDDADRMKKHIEAPDRNMWARQYQVMHVFDELIYNTDRNAQNILYDDKWHLWMIDHTRAFRLSKQLMNVKKLERCDRELLERMKELNLEELDRELGPWLRPPEISAILARRDRLVSFFETHPERLYNHIAMR